MTENRKGNWVYEAEASKAGVDVNVFTVRERKSHADELYLE
jgi:hypothetical protein